MIPLEIFFLCEPSLLSPLLLSWYFIRFFFLYPSSALSWELWVLKSASAKGRSVDLNMDAGKCQLSNSEQHPSIWQLEKEKVCLSQLKSTYLGLEAATGQQAPLTG